MLDQLRALIAQLRLHGMAGALDAELARAEREAIAAPKLLFRLLGHEARGAPRAQPRLSPGAGAPGQYDPSSPSTGKTGLAMGLLREACLNGYRGRFYNVQVLLDELYASLADRTTTRLLAQMRDASVAD